MTWQDRAACIDADPYLFHPEPADVHACTPLALAICGRCPAVTECLYAALEEEDGKPLRHRYGIRGGMTSKERWEISRTTWTCQNCGALSTGPVETVCIPCGRPEMCPDQRKYGGRSVRI